MLVNRMVFLSCFCYFSNISSTSVPRQVRPYFYDKNLFPITDFDLLISISILLLADQNAFGQSDFGK